MWEMLQAADGQGLIMHLGLQLYHVVYCYLLCLLALLGADLRRFGGDHNFTIS